MCSGESFWGRSRSHQIILQVAFLVEFLSKLKGCHHQVAWQSAWDRSTWLGKILHISFVKRWWYIFFMNSPNCIDHRAELYRTTIYDSKTQLNLPGRSVELRQQYPLLHPRDQWFRLYGHFDRNTIEPGNICRISTFRAFSIIVSKCHIIHIRWWRSRATLRTKMVYQIPIYKFPPTHRYAEFLSHVESAHVFAPRLKTETKRLIFQASHREWEP